MILTILNSIANTGSTNHKLLTLNNHADNEILKRVYRLAYHPQIQFGIKKIPEYEQSSGSLTVNIEHALNVLENTLAKRVVTGNAAIVLLQDILKTLSPNDAEVIKRIIKRDLNCGASATIANKVWKNLIPKQPQMLASAYSDKAIAKIKFPAYAQLKADGARCFAEIRGDSIEDVKFLSRAGNEYYRLDDIAQQLIDATKEYREKHPGGVMVDGELVYVKKSKPKSYGLDFLMDNDDPKDENTVVLRSESNGFANKSLKNTITIEEAKNMSFQVWDLVPLDIVYSEDGLKSEPYQNRFHELTWCIDTSFHTNLIVIENTIVNNLEEAKTIYKNYVLQGLEGIILKNINAIWENKRSANQVKFKEEITVDLRIVDYIPHTKEPNKIGSFVLESDCKRIKVKSGSGLTDTDEIKTNELDEYGENIWVEIPIEERSELNRARLFKFWEEIKNTIIEIKCNGFTTDEKRKDSVSLFLPIILKLRSDKTETNTFAELFPDAKIEFED